MRPMISTAALLVAALTGIAYSTEASASDMTVRVTVYDDTESRPLHPEAEIWARGLGSWWLARESWFPAMKDLEGRTPGKVDQLVIYPDGREGNEITVQFQMTADMCPDACAKYMIVVAIDDSNVTVDGYPLEGPYGEMEVVFPRN